VLYLIALGFSIFIQTPTVKRMIALTSGGPAAGGPPAGGPPPELAALAQRSRQGGMLLATLVVAIVFLMVVKPF